MGTIYAKGRGGRKPVLAYVDGELVHIKPLSMIGNSVGIILPKEWLTLTEYKMGKRPEKVAITYNVSDLASVITIRAYFGEVV